MVKKGQFRVVFRMVKRGSLGWLLGWLKWGSFRVVVRVVKKGQFRVVIRWSKGAV